MRRRLLTVIFAALCAAVVCAQVQRNAPKRNFVRGADISWCTEMEADGRRFFDADGHETDIFVLMKQLGMNAIRLRVWVNPTAYGYGPWSDKADVLAKARRAHAQGLDLMIDFHYSDFFADPGRQLIPIDWQGLTYEQLMSAVADHTRDVLQALKDEGIEPRWVQIGNETATGMLHPMGRINWEIEGSAFADYVPLSNAGYDAVKEVFPNAMVIIQMCNTSQWKWFVPAFIAECGKADMIGMSFYPTPEEWNVNLVSAIHSNIIAAQHIRSASKAIDLPIMLCETGFEVAEPALAHCALQDLMDRLSNISGCEGVFFWEPQTDGVWMPSYYQSLGWQPYAMGGFTPDGRPSEALIPFAAP